MTTIDPLMTAAEAAEALGISVDAVRRLTRSGQLRGIKLGGNPRGRTRIRREDLEAYRRRE
ncbi:MAG: helix-turn-helix domain-containing protein [Methanomicrobiaceae archaeon]|nr:helix-turn-helix domain-containing protein [Methanomicrobiaceae archaeon]